jgi:hypothetical protein
MHRTIVPLSTALEDRRAHHKPEDKQDHKDHDKDEEEHLGDPAAAHVNRPTQVYFTKLQLFVGQPGC